MSSLTMSRPGLSQTHEYRWALAGLLLAVVLLVMLVVVMKENVAVAQDIRLQAEQQSQDRSRCNGLQQRRDREQCLLDLRLGNQAQLALR